MLTNKDHNLTCFFVFNPLLVTNEKEESKKILFYYPCTTNLDAQLKTVGLCEALIKFSSSFTTKKSCEVFTTEKTKYFFDQIEPNYWMVLGIQSQHNSELIADNVYRNTLCFMYKMFRLFHGTLERLESIDVIKIRLNEFFVKYLDEYNVVNSTFLNIFCGVHFLPLGKEPFLHIVSFLNKLELEFSMIKHSLLLYNNQLVWSSIHPDDMQVMYQYLIQITKSASNVDGNFLSSEGIIDLQFPNKVPTIFLNDGKSYQLVIYNLLSLTLCILMEDNVKFECFQELSTFLEPIIPKLVSEISDFIAQSNYPQLDPVPRFVYFNSINKALKNTLNDKLDKGERQLPPEAFQLITDINKLCCDNGEIIIKTVSDLWIAGKVSAGREFYVVSQKKSSLMEVGVEIKKICDSQLKGIFFLE